MKNTIKIIKYISIFAVLLNIANGQTTYPDNISTAGDNVVLSNEEEKEMFTVLNEIQEVQNKDIVKIQAQAGADVILKVNEPFKLDGSESIGDIIGYEWTYKGNVISNMPIINLSIKRSGSFEMILEVTDSRGEVSTDTVIIDVESHYVK